MKRYIRSDSKIKPTANVYAIAAAMGWRSPNLSRSREGYLCRSTWDAANSTREWPCVEGFLRKRYDKIRSQIDTDYPVDYESQDYYTQFIANHNAWELAMRELKPLAIQDMQAVVDEIEDATGIQCTFSRRFNSNGYLVVPYAD